MTERLWLYPRLPRPVAEGLVARLEGMSPSERLQTANLNHPRAAPAPTGGSPVPEDHLADLADAVRAEFGEELGEPLPAGREALVDARFGLVLYDNMGIIASDAAQEGVWSFLSIVLLPDVATWRFPDCHRARLLGTHRNVFRRTWWRRHVLGDIVDPEPSGTRRPLGEDELVGIFERSRMARSHELARCLARYILDLEIPDRSEFARDLAKRVRRILAYISVDSLPSEWIEALVEDAGSAAMRARANRS